jgi:hypothetical protein
VELLSLCLTQVTSFGYASFVIHYRLWETFLKLDVFSISSIVMLVCSSACLFSILLSRKPACLHVEEVLCEANCRAHSLICCMYFNKIWIFNCLWMYYTVLWGCTFGRSLFRYGDLRSVCHSCVPRRLCLYRYSISYCKTWALSKCIQTVQDPFGSGADF